MPGIVCFWVFRAGVGVKSFLFLFWKNLPGIVCFWVIRAGFGVESSVFAGKFLPGVVCVVMIRAGVVMRRDSRCDLVKTETAGIEMMREKKKGDRSRGNVELETGAGRKCRRQCLGQRRQRGGPRLECEEG